MEESGYEEMAEVLAWGIQVVELLNLHSSSLVLLDIAKQTTLIELYPIVVCIPRFAEKYRWMPILCYISEVRKTFAE